MGTVVFDFDSTLVPVESLEETLRAGGVSAERLASIEAVTRDGMEGRIPYRVSLERRLAMAAPRRADVARVAEDLAGRLTHGAEEVVAAVAARGHGVFIVSGAFRDVLLPSARRLGIPPERVWGVRARWDGEGRFLGLQDEDPMREGKVEGVRGLPEPWPRPAVGVGDGATDLALLRAGLVDVFLAYTEHQRRPGALEGGVPEVRSMEALARHLEDLLP